MVLKKLILANHSIIRKTIELPNGKSITLGECGLREYLIENREELEFLTKQRDVLIVDPTAKECSGFIERLPEIPVVDTSLTVEEAKAFDPSELEEDLLKDELLKRGYDVVKTTSSDDMSSLISRVSDVTLIQEFSKRCKENPELIKASGITIETVSEIDFSNASLEEVKQYLAKFGYIGIRKI